MYPKTNYEVMLEAMRVEGEDFFCGSTFPVGDEFCTLIVGGWGGKVIGLSNIDGQAANTNQSTQYRSFQKNHWVSIRVRITDEQIDVWLDEEEIINHVRKGENLSIWPEQKPMTPFGIATWKSTGAIRSIRRPRL